ncbi:hypothetical protein N0V82_002704 [Gnomoniopsis sp. IMI 355080]|nr:hypothetical protein N0V82_002704 [Gnomoniopsis sp. IMI 355080]
MLWIEISDFPVDIVDSVIRYIYTGVVGFAEASLHESPVSAFVDLWVAADFFVFNPLTLLQAYFDDKLTKMALMETANQVNHLADPILDQLVNIERNHECLHPTPTRTRENLPKASRRRH